MKNLLLHWQRYAEAETAFEHVLKLDENCEDAVEELHKTRISRLMVSLTGAREVPALSTWPDPARWTFDLPLTCVHTLHLITFKHGAHTAAVDWIYSQRALLLENLKVNGTLLNGTKAKTNLLYRVKSVSAFTVHFLFVLLCPIFPHCFACLLEGSCPLGSFAYVAKSSECRLKSWSWNLCPWVRHLNISACIVIKL